MKTAALWVTGFLAIVAVLALELVSPALSAADGQTHKVIAPPLILDADAEGIELWHDYGAFALSRVSDTALNQLPPEVRSKVIMSGEMDRSWLLNKYDAAPLGAQKHGADISEADKDRVASESDFRSEPALHLIQFVGPVKDEWLQEVETTGAALVHYIATNGYLLWADADSRQELDRLAG